MTSWGVYTSPVLTITTSCDGTGCVKVTYSLDEGHALGCFRLIFPSLLGNPPRLLLQQPHLIQALT